MMVGEARFCPIKSKVSIGARARPRIRAELPTVRLPRSAPRFALSSANGQYVVSGRKYSTRSIDCTGMSRMSTPCNTRSLITSPARVRSQSFW